MELACPGSLLTEYGLQFRTAKIHKSTIQNFSWYLRVNFRQAPYWHSFWQPCAARCAVASVNVWAFPTFFQRDWLHDCTNTELNLLALEHAQMQLDIPLDTGSSHQRHWCPNQVVISSMKTLLIDCRHSPCRPDCQKTTTGRRCFARLWRTIYLMWFMIQSSVSIFADNCKV